MSERITEAELAYWETRRGAQQRLVSEVRRLRGLIADWWDKDGLPEDEMAFNDLEAEAEAIRAEGLDGTEPPGA